MYRKADRLFTQRSLGLTILAANVLTYSVLGPLYYWTTRPMWNEVDDITPDSSWAMSTEARIFYVDSETRNLMTIHADGCGRETWVPHPMLEYLLSGDLNFCVFLGEKGDLHYYDRPSDRHVVLGPAGEDASMGRIALSPSHKRVAVWRSPATDSSLCLYEVSTGATQTHKLGGGKHSSWSSGLAWSEDENLLYLEMENTAYEVRLSEIFSDPIPLSPVSARGPLCPCFGRFSNFSWRVGGTQRLFNVSDSCGDKLLRVEQGLGSGVVVSSQDLQSKTGEYKHKKWFAINPGILHGPSWWFLEGSFLLSCDEIIIEDFTSIYLWDMTQRKIGKVTTGERHMVLTEAYRKERLFTKGRI